MAVWKFLKIFIITLMIFIVFNFFLSNINSETLGYKLSFHFNVPPFLQMESIDFSVGYLLILAFCIGMLISAFMGSVNVFYRSKDIKSKARVIRELEAELRDLRSHLHKENYSSYEERPKEHGNHLPDNPVID